MRGVRAFVAPLVAPQTRAIDDLGAAVARLQAEVGDVHRSANAIAERSANAFASLELRADAADRMQSEVVQAVGMVRDRIEPLVDGAYARPFMAGEPFAPFDDPDAGVVYGYRGRSAEPEADEYRAFEDLFRGSEDRVRERQRPYLALIGGRAPVLDAGCGRGEFLDLMAEAGIEAAGVDLDAGMVQCAAAKGHRVRRADLNEHLESLDDDSLGVVFCAQVIEHMPEDQLRRFFALARGKLAPGGRLVAETVNPHAPGALRAFWVDLTHEHPIFPEVALTLARIAGFRSAFVFHPTGQGDPERDRVVEPAYAVVATKAP